MANRPSMRQIKDVPTETASETIVHQAAEIKYAVDSRGRKIGVIKPSALHRFRLFKILGPENSKNEPLIGQAMMAFLVRDIDGEPVVINTERQLEALISRLDDDGLGAVLACLVEQHGMTYLLQAGDDNGAAVELVKN